MRELLKEATAAVTELGTDGAETDDEYAARVVLATVEDWLHDEETEVAIAAELLREHGDTDLTAARTAVRDVLDIVRGWLDKEVGVL